MPDTFVDFTTNLGDIVIQLFADDAPLTVQDFLNYAQNQTVGAGYTSSFFHRLAAGFVLQGGGYDVNNGKVEQITTGAPVQNEYSDLHPNVKGTVALAKAADDPNSGTDQFFINLADNSAKLDTQNGGFTVFGQVTDASWPVVQAIADLPTVIADAPFDQLPVENYTAGDLVTASNLVLVTGVTVTQGVPCYCAGTLIATDRGDVAVEALAVGDRVVTVSGEHHAVQWIGRRSYAGRFLDANPAVRPILFRAGSLGHGLPRRDLRVSPLHAMLLDGVLVPAGLLVNGTAIVQDLDQAEVDYFHVELARHDVLLAEGAPAESFVDDGSRFLFHNAAEWQGHADRTGTPNFCARRVENGPELDAIRRRLDGGGIHAVAINRIGCHHIPVRDGAHAVRLVAEARHVPGDARRLGAAISRVALDGVDIPLDDPCLTTGWHPCEGAWRWMADAAVLITRGARTVSLEVVALPFAAAA